MVAILCVAVVLVIVGFGAYGNYRRSQRRQQIPQIAAQKGLRYSATDPFGLGAVAFPLLRAGDGRRVESVLWSDADAETGPQALGPTRVFDYGYYKVHRDRTGREIEEWSWFTCAMAQTDGQWPTLRISHQGMVGKAIDLIAGDPIQFESDEFNETFRVTCDDRRFASALIDPAMMQFLLETKGAIDFETRGRFVLLSSDQLPADEMPILLGLAREFVRRVPAATWALYPKLEPLSAPDPAPPPAPTSTDDADPADAWDPTPGVDYDLDGHPIEPEPEDPWHEHRIPPHDHPPA